MPEKFSIQHMSNKTIIIALFSIGVFLSIAFATLFHTNASAASNETHVGQQVITVGKTKTTTQFYACKISQGSGYYKVRVRAFHNNTIALANGGYRLNIGSNLGSSTSASKYVNSRVPVTSVVSNGKAKSTIRFTTYLGYKSNSGYTVTSGTTLRSFTVGSIKTC